MTEIGSSRLLVVGDEEEQNIRKQQRHGEIGVTCLCLEKEYVTYIEDDWYLIIIFERAKPFSQSNKNVNVMKTHIGRKIHSPNRY